MDFNSVHRQFTAVLNRFVSSRVSNQDDVADILQEIFIKISSNIHLLNSEEKLKSWIFTISRNAITDYYRRNSLKKEIRLEDYHNFDMASEQVIDFSAGMESCLAGFIDKLPAQYKQIIIESEINGVSQKVLAKKYNLAYPSLRSRVQRGRAKLKDMLLGCCSIELDRRGNILSASLKNSGEKKCGGCD